MAYGTGEYGQSEFGGSSFEAGGPNLVSSDPPNGSYGVAKNDTVTLVIASEAGLDLNTLSVTFDGDPAIVGGLFQPGYSGSITQNPETNVTIFIGTHPDFSGYTSVDIYITDNAGLSAVLNVLFTSGYTESVYESLVISDTVGAKATLSESVVESLTVSDDVFAGKIYEIDLSETLTLDETLTTGTFQAIIGSEGREFLVYFVGRLRIDYTSDLRNYDIELLADGFPVRPFSASAITNELQTGTTATVIPSGGVLSYQVELDADLNSSQHDNTYLEFSGGQNTGIFRIVDVLQESPGIALLDRPVYVFEPITSWRHTTAVVGVRFQTTKFTNLGFYRFAYHNLLDSETGMRVSESGSFLALNVPKPRLSNISYLEDGTLLVEYNEPMLVDESLTNLGDYSIAGPSNVKVVSIDTVDSYRVLLHLANVVFGTYTLNVSVATPKDLAGNPLDPVYNSAIFTGDYTISSRSIFTDKGPISKPPLTLQSGTGALVQSFTSVEFPGASFDSSAVGQYVRLDAGTDNGGTFLVLGLIDSTHLRLQASLTYPSSDILDWELFDPRNGQIADDPGDVTVWINGSPVTPDAVIGLLGQVVLNSVPDPADDVKVDYSFCCNPVVEVRRLNSKEFRLNSWNRDQGYLRGSQHHYRYNNVLIRPSDFSTDSILAGLDSPLQRDLKYRAYERAYTPVLNDPNLLLLNSPIHRIAYPPSERTLSEDFETYECLTLPENHTVPWVRVGAGQASVSAGVLTVEDDSNGYFPNGNPIYWTQGIDLSFDHVFAVSWRFSLDVVTETDGVFTGVAAGYSDEYAAVVVGFLDDGGVKKVGILKSGATDPGDIDSWTGALNSVGDSLGVPAELDWSVLHSYRLFRDLTGVIRIYVDGDIVATLKVTSSEIPPLLSVPAPFDNIQGVFFGSISRPARSVSNWDFFRYLITPTNSRQTALSNFVSYEANVVPENDPKPWTPVGYAGVETILSADILELSSTSASDFSSIGAVTGDFRGFCRIEPLLTQSSQVVFDAEFLALNYTHGLNPNGLMFAIDDGERLMQVSFLSFNSSPKLSYGGRSLPEEFSPFIWTRNGGESSEMHGRLLRIIDSVSGDGLVYSIEDPYPYLSDLRTVSYGFSYVLECRMQVLSYTPDVNGFVGAFAQVFDGLRLVGIQLSEVSGTRYVELMSDGTTLMQFEFDWSGAGHSYRLRKNHSGNLVTLFVDDEYQGSLPYSSFSSTTPASTGMLSFGSSTPLSSDAVSVVDWVFCNAIRIQDTPRYFVGLWRGFDGGSLTGYHLPTKTSGKNAEVAGNAMGDPYGYFVTRNVVAGDFLVVDYGPNKGTYEVQNVTDNSTLTITSTWPHQPSVVDYRIIREVDWTVSHKYRLYRDSTGGVSLILDTETEPIIQVSIASTTFPESSAGIIQTLSGGLPAVVFGGFSDADLLRTQWDFVRYGITRSPLESNIAPHHQVLNQWNVMHSPERLWTTIPHSLTDFKSSSTGIVPKEDPDLFENPSLTAFTLLNEGTPLVPSTQTSEVRSAYAPFATQEYIAVLNRPEDILNSGGALILNDASTQYRLVVPDDVLYNSLDVIESSEGEEGLLKPFDDECQPSWGPLYYTKQVCLEYDGSTLPEDDTAAPTPWVLNSDTPANVSVSVSGGILTYGTAALGTKTVYLNNTPLLDAPSLTSEALFRVRVTSDGTYGTDDSQIRLGLSAPGLTVGIALVTIPDGRRFVLIVDLKANQILGSAQFDFLDGAYHTYRVVRDPGHAMIRVSIDS